MNFLKRVLLLSIGIVLLAGCQLEAPEENADNEGIKVVASFYPVYEFAQQIVGEEGVVSMLVDAGQDTHGFEPTPKDMVAIADADVFIYSSTYMETWVPAVLETLDDSDVIVIEAGDGLSFYEDEEEEGHEHHEDDGHHHIVDPHIWLDLTFAQEMVATIATGIQQVDEENAPAYAENAAIYRSELAKLDEEFQAAFEGAGNRTFVAQHAAFGYLARRYDLEEVAISSLTSDQEVSPAQIAKIGEFMQEQNISVIYYQDSASSKVAETLAMETNSELELLSAIEGIPDEQQAEGVNYLTLMRQNLAALKKTIR